MEKSIVTVKGQVVIPSRIRRKYKIKKGTVINFYEIGDEIKLVPVTHELIEKYAGVLGTKGKLLKSLMEEKKSEREL